MSLEDIVAKYRGKAVLVDTNLLVLLATGVYSRSKIATFNRTRQYTLQDFNLLVRLLDLFRQRIITPHIAAEADNLARQMPGANFGRLAVIVSAIISQSFEIYCPSSEAVQHERFSMLGITDCTILAASHDALVLTDDFRLSSILSHLGRDAININHLRFSGWA